ncbi:MAG: hypothetical protein PHS07_00980 [Patescibacteria group bacterium]|nr:hypothetical protein [Patescibacteria group bacterium]
MTEGYLLLAQIIKTGKLSPDKIFGFWERTHDPTIGAAAILSGVLSLDKMLQLREEANCHEVDLAIVRSGKLMPDEMIKIAENRNHWEIWGMVADQFVSQGFSSDEMFNFWLKNPNIIFGWMLIEKNLLSPDQMAEIFFITDDEKAYRLIMNLLSDNKNKTE